MLRIFFLIFVSLLPFYPAYAQLPQENSYAFIGDAGKWNNNTENLRDSLVRNSKMRLINAGDNLYYSILGPKTYDEAWQNWNGFGFEFYATAIGNHNLSYPAEIAYFKLPGEFYAVSDSGVARFIVLNSDDVQNAAQQAAFLETELLQATEPFLFIVYHHPSYTLSVTHPASEKKAFQDAIKPLLFKYRSKITALLLGHEHVALVAHFNDLPAVVNGAGQSPVLFIPFFDPDAGASVVVNWYRDGTPYWVNISLNVVSSTAQLDYVRATDDRDTCTLTIKTGHAAQFLPNCSMN